MSRCVASVASLIRVSSPSTWSIHSLSVVLSIVLVVLEDVAVLSATMEREEAGAVQEEREAANPVRLPTSAIVA